MFFGLAGADTNDAIQAIERDVAPLFSRHSDEIFLNSALFARVDKLWQAREALGLERRAEARPRPLPHHLPARRRRARRGRQDAARRDQRAARHARHAVRPERARRREGLDAGARRRGRSRRPARLGSASAAAAAAEERGLPGKHVITLARSLDRAVPHLLDPPRSPREGLRGLDRPRRDRAATATTARSSPRSRRSAPRRRSSSATRPTPISASPTRWRRRRRRSPACSRRCGSAAGPGARARGRGPPGAHRRGGRQPSPRRLRLAALCREDAEAPVRFRRGGAEAVSPARQDDRGRLLHRRPALRPLLRRGPRRAGLQPGRPRLEGDGRRTGASSACSSAITSPAPRSGAAPG